MKGIKQPNGRYKYDTLKESDIQNQITDWLTLKRFMWYRQNTGCMVTGKRFIRFGIKGMPDLVVIIAGVYCGLEVKKRDGELSRSQLEFGNRLKSAGAKYFVVHSLDEAQLAIAEVRGAK